MQSEGWLDCMLCMFDERMHGMGYAILGTGDAYVYFQCGEVSKDSQMSLIPSLPNALTSNSCHAHTRQAE